MSRAPRVRTPGRNPPTTNSAEASALTFTQSSERRSEEHTSELQSREKLLCRLLLEKKNSRTGTLRLVNASRKAPYSEMESLYSVDEKGVRENPALLFFFNDTATTEIYTLSLHAALPI